MGPNQSVGSLAPGGYFKLQFLRFLGMTMFFFFFFFFFPSSMELALVESTGTLRTGLGHSSRSKGAPWPDGASPIWMVIPG